MAIPDYQTLMLPVLEAAASGEVEISDVVVKMAEGFHLTPEERRQLLPSGNQTIIANRTHWAKTYLSQAGLVQKTKRAHFTITTRGQEVLATKPAKVDVQFLMQFPEFQDFRAPWRLRLHHRRPELHQRPANSQKGYQ